MAASGIPRIDRLFGPGDAVPIGPDDPDVDAVAVVQDFLIGHAFPGLPGVLSAGRGRFGPKTTEAVRTFQQSHGLPPTSAVDRSTLQAFVGTPAPRPLVARGYVTLVLDIAFAGIVRLMSLTAQFEGAGFFGAFNANTDKAGLSFGLIQWAQKPGRLRELLQAFQIAEPALFVQIFGGGDPAVAQGLIAHTAKPGGGVDQNGGTTDPHFDLIAEPWRSRFNRVALSREFQHAQITLATQAFEASLHRIRTYATTIRSERGLAFMLDLANQFGDGGARSIFQKVAQPGLSEGQTLIALEAESVARITPAFAASTRNRREAFRTIALLSDDPLPVA
jgi:hypothetical protein